jgi:hypothetical protein
MKSEQLQILVKQNLPIFWDIDQSKINKLSDEVIFERFLGYSDIPQIKKLIQILGNEKAFLIFKKISQKDRKNLRPQTINLFKLYFQNGSGKLKWESKGNS